MSKTTRTMWFLTTVYNQYNEYEPRPLRGYHSKKYAEAVCDRLMKWEVDYSNWEVACDEYLDAHSELQKIPMRDNLYSQTRCKLKEEWIKANPFTSIAKRHDKTFTVTGIPVKV